MRLETAHIYSKTGSLGSQTHFLMIPRASWLTGQWPQGRAAQGHTWEMDGRRMLSLPHPGPRGRCLVEKCRLAKGCVSLFPGLLPQPTVFSPQKGRPGQRQPWVAPSKASVGRGTEHRPGGQEAGEGCTSLCRFGPVHFSGLSFPICNTKRGTSSSFCGSRQADPSQKQNCSRSKSGAWGPLETPLCSYRGSMQ